MAGMVGDTELLGNHRCDHDRCPNPAHEAIGNGATIKDFAQMRSLLCRQPVRATRTMSFQEPVHTIPLPVAEPDRYIGTVDLQEGSNRGTGPALHIQQNRVNPLGHAIGAIFYGRLLELGELLNQLRSSMDKARLHRILRSDCSEDITRRDTCRVIYARPSSS